MSKRRLTSALQARSPLAPREAVAPADLYQTGVGDPESRIAGNPENPKAGKSGRPRVEKYSTLLRPATIKAIKREALERDLKDYEIVQAALDAYLPEPPESGKAGKPE